MPKVAYPLEPTGFNGNGGMSFGAGGFMPPAYQVTGSQPSAVAPVVSSGSQVTPSSVAPQPLQVNPGNQFDTSPQGLSTTVYNDARMIAREMSEYNTQQSQAFAREQMRFQEAQNAKAMQFSADQAKLNRDFQERMSNSSHQREVQDLIKAGLNPVLSALAGSSTPSGSAASGVTSSGAAGTVDTTANQLISSVLNALIGQETAVSVAEVNKQAAIQSANINARSQKDINEATLSNQLKIAHDYPTTESGVAMRLLNDVKAAITGVPSSAKGYYMTYENGRKIRHLY